MRPHSVLPEPPRGPNGYKEYGVTDLVRVLQIRRLVDLGVPLAEVARVGEDTAGLEATLRSLDAEASDTIERMTAVRREIATMLEVGASLELPVGAQADGKHVSDADRSLFVVLSRVLGPEALEAWRALVLEQSTSESESGFSDLSADTDEATRQAMAEDLVTFLHRAWDRHPALRDATTNSPRGPVFVERAVTEALLDLYNRAQIDVLVRMERILQAESVTSESEVTS